MIVSTLSAICPMFFKVGHEKHQTKSATIFSTSELTAQNQSLANKGNCEKRLGTSLLPQKVLISSVQPGIQPISSSISLRTYAK